ncbi:asparaginase [Caldimonas thermodepolymerans]|uniref:asparaginase n=1 Tax=Caldimonas thermodepolymerans TaxID=215580 RepID=UPI0022360C7F|nr:asparaginase [Caldimonas thermodepolymerans]UZG42777.1 asparaginase [Caldimonas thermodepolymerans]
MQSNEHGPIVILGTGGTIAGTAADPHDNVGYRAAQLGVADLVAAVPALARWPLETEQVAQLDSKDMDFGVWQLLAQRVAHHLARPEVRGVVVTHGTDTLEETAYFLHRLLAPAKPVVMVAAMRPASALRPDGPQNLLDAVTVAATPGARGVLAVLAGQVHSGLEVRKVHTYRLDAFGSGDAGPLGYVEEGRLRQLRDWPQGEPLGLACLPASPAGWPWVEIVSSHAGADGRWAAALAGLPVQGLVVVGTGNGTVHERLEAELVRAQARGVRVLRCSRCAEGVVVPTGRQALPSAGALTPWKARVELMLQLMAAG